MFRNFLVVVIPTLVIFWVGWAVAETFWRR
jgi:hypothetical protein